jgi:hypothetical protein
LIWREDAIVHRAFARTAKAKAIIDGIKVTSDGFAKTPSEREIGRLPCDLLAWNSTGTESVYPPVPGKVYNFHTAEAIVSGFAVEHWGCWH